ncbi:MAG: hypothetical protein WCV90_02500 [Candidatus Woesearchaeota archaeon]|jgi:hypothetical protein
MADPEFRKGDTRFYVITAAVVIVLLAGLFFWFFGKGAWVTGASTYDESTLAVSDSSAPFVSTESSSVSNSLSSDDGSTRVVSGMKAKLSLDVIPTIKRETKADDMDIKFSNLNTQIKVNKESLQLDSIQEVDLKIHGFVGEMLLNGKTLSLNGQVSRLQVNGVVLSSAGMQIAFDGLDYQTFSADAIDLEQLNIVSANGKMDLLNGKIDYTLESKDKVTFNTVFGNFVANKDNGENFNAELVFQNAATAGAVNAVFQ